MGSSFFLDLPAGGGGCDKHSYIRLVTAEWPWATHLVQLSKGTLQGSRPIITTTVATLTEHLPALDTCCSLCNHHGNPRTRSLICIFQMKKLRCRAFSSVTLDGAPRTEADSGLSCCVMGSWVQSQPRYFGETETNSSAF